MNQTLANRDYLNKVIIPFFLPMVEQKLHFIIFDNHDQVVICSQLKAQEMGYNDWQELRGKPYRELNRPMRLASNVQEGSPIDQDYNLLCELYNNLKCLREFIIEEGRPASVAIIQPFTIKMSADFFIQTYAPLFNPQGEVIAISAMSTNLSWFGMSEFLNELDSADLHTRVTNDKLRITPLRELPIHLTERQHEIVFLLTNGLSQGAIASLLHVSRGSIAKTISQSICPKFDIWGSCTVLLVEKAKALNLHLMLPKSFCKPRFVILDHEMAQRYHDYRERNSDTTLMHLAG